MGIFYMYLQNTVPLVYSQVQKVLVKMAAIFDLS